MELKRADISSSLSFEWSIGRGALFFRSVARVLASSSVIAMALWWSDEMNWMCFARIHLLSSVPRAAAHPFVGGSDYYHDNNIYSRDLN